MPDAVSSSSAIVGKFHLSGDVVLSPSSSFESGWQGELGQSISIWMRLGECRGNLRCRCAALMDGLRRSRWTQKSHSHSPLQTEATALLTAARITTEAHQYFHVIHDFWDVVGAFCHWSCKRVNRMDNSIAHNLGQLGMKQSDLGMYIFGSNAPSNE